MVAQGLEGMSVCLTQHRYVLLWPCRELSARDPHIPLPWWACECALACPQLHCSACYKRRRLSVKVSLTSGSSLSWPRPWWRGLPRHHSLAHIWKYCRVSESGPLLPGSLPKDVCGSPVVICLLPWMWPPLSAISDVCYSCSWYRLHIYLVQSQG